MSKRKVDLETDKEMETTDQKSSATVPAQADGDDDVIIGTANPLGDYNKLIKARVTLNYTVKADTEQNFRKIAKAACDVIWQLLFGDVAGDADSQKKASELLEEHKGYASLYDPLPYNDWIVKVRDELLKRQLLDYWRDTIVCKELGPCWSYDLGFDTDDEPPLEFYAHAGCEAPFTSRLKAKREETVAEEQERIEAERESNNTAALTGEFEAQIGMIQPLNDYCNLMNRFVLTTVIVPDNIHKKNVEKIGQAARNAIWELLFNGASTEMELDKAVQLLEVYKSDAGFYGPWQFNEWIVKVRDELLQREMLAFWGEKIVKLELGPCCWRDSDFFDVDDSLPLEFYNKAGFKAPFHIPQN